MSRAPFLCRRCTTALTRAPGTLPAALDTWCPKCGWQVDDEDDDDTAPGKPTRAEATAPLAKWNRAGFDGDKPDPRDV